MQLWSRLKTCPAIWLSPVTVLILAAEVHGRVPEFADQRVELLAVNAASAVGILAPLATLMGAIDGLSLRRARLHLASTTRNPLKVALSAPLLSGGITALIAMLAIFYRAGTLAVGLDILLPVPAILCAWAIFGAGLATLLHPGIALPAGMLSSYALMMFARSSLDPIWLRHVTGFWVSSFGSDSVLSGRAVIASMVVALALVAIGTALIRVGILGSPLIPRNGYQRGLTLVVASCAIFAVALSIAGSIAKDLGPLPATARANETLCRNSNPTICLWPEHTHQFSTVSSSSATAFAAWRELGVRSPSLLSEYPRANALKLHVSSFSQAPDIVTSLAYAISSAAVCGTPSTADQAAVMNVTTILVMATNVKPSPGSVSAEVAAMNEEQREQYARDFLTKRPTCAG